MTTEIPIRRIPTNSKLFRVRTAEGLLLPVIPINGARDIFPTWNELSFACREAYRTISEGDQSIIIDRKRINNLRRRKPTLKQETALAEKLLKGPAHREPSNAEVITAGWVALHTRGALLVFALFENPEFLVLTDLPSSAQPDR